MNIFDDSFFKRLSIATTVSSTGVRHAFCDSVFQTEVYERLRKEFPNPSTFTLVDKSDSGGGHKRFYVGPEYVVVRDYNSLHGVRGVSKLWKTVIDEVSSPTFIRALSEATGVKCNSICNFGFAYGDESCIQEPHLDGAIRKGVVSRVKSNIAFLLYFNDVDDPVSATELYDLDRMTILAKGDTMMNSLFFFEQHPNSWHGFPLVPKGHTRRIISLSYSFEDEAIRPLWGYLPWMRVRMKKFINRALRRG